MLPSEFDFVLIDGDNLLHRVRGMRDDAGLRWLLPRLRAWLPAGTRALVMLDGHPDPGDSFRRHVATGVDFQHSGTVDADTAIVGTLAARPYAERSRTVVVTDDRALGDRARRVGGLVRRLDWLVGGLAAAVGDAAGGPVQSAESARGMFTAGMGSEGATAGLGSEEAQPHGMGPATGRARTGVRPVGIGGGRRKAPRNAASSQNPRPGGPAPAPDDREAQEREPWKPGRGATTKHGNPKREPKGGA